MRTAVLIPNWNGRHWLPALLDSLDAQQRPPDELLVVDNGSTDGSLELLAERGVSTLELGRNAGFAAAANRGIAVVETDIVALVNTDVELADDWLARVADRLERDPGLAAVATKVVRLHEPLVLDDCGDVLRRDGVAEQRGHGRRDDGRWDAPGEVFSASAGAAAYRRDAVTAVGGFDERLFAYLEDVDLGLRLRLAGWRCAYEPTVARHARRGSSGQLRRPPQAWVARNTLLLVAKAFPLRWLPYVAYRQAAWAWHAARGRRLGSHLSGVAAALPLLRTMISERRALREGAAVPVDVVVPARPWRGPRAGGHPKSDT